MRPQCKTCKWRGLIAGFGKARFPHCRWSEFNQRTCLRKDGKEIKDIRGDDKEHCLLYAPGQLQRK